MKGDDIFERLVSIAVQSVRVVEALPSTATTKHIGQQLVRSATSGGANYQEARGAESRNDFVHKLGVALKETRETHYWLRLLDGLGLAVPERVYGLLRETLEVSKILASSIRTAKTGASRGRQEQATENREPGAGNWVTSD
jgi:four helix bundle protein